MTATTSLTGFGYRMVEIRDREDDQVTFKMYANGPVVVRIEGKSVVIEPTDLRTLLTEILYAQM